jgi:hypothetical protein
VPVRWRSRLCLQAQLVVRLDSEIGKAFEMPRGPTDRLQRGDGQYRTTATHLALWRLTGSELTAMSSGERRNTPKRAQR